MQIRQFRLDDGLYYCIGDIVKTLGFSGADAIVARRKILSGISAGDITTATYLGGRWGNTLVKIQVISQQAFYDLVQDYPQLEVNHAE